MNFDALNLEWVFYKSGWQCADFIFVHYFEGLILYLLRNIGKLFVF